MKVSHIVLAAAYVVWFMAVMLAIFGISVDGTLTLALIAGVISIGAAVVARRESGR